MEKMVLDEEKKRRLDQYQNKRLPVDEKLAIYIFGVNLGFISVILAFYYLQLFSLPVTLVSIFATSIIVTLVGLRMNTGNKNRRERELNSAFITKEGIFSFQYLPQISGLGLRNLLLNKQPFTVDKQPFDPEDATAQAYEVYKTLQKNDRVSITYSPETYIICKIDPLSSQATSEARKLGK